jgi:hypothetical protein
MGGEESELATRLLTRLIGVGVRPLSAPRLIEILLTLNQNWSNHIFCACPSTACVDNCKSRLKTIYQSSIGQKKREKIKNEEKSKESFGINVQKDI